MVVDRTRLRNTGDEINKQTKKEKNHINEAKKKRMRERIGRQSALIDRFTRNRRLLLVVVDSERRRKKRENIINNHERAGNSPRAESAKEENSAGCPERLFVWLGYLERNRNSLLGREERLGVIRSLR
jgi:hypothetical protein